MHIDQIAREAKEKQEKIQADLASMKGVLDHLKDIIFNLNDLEHNSDPPPADVA